MTRSNVVILMKQRRKPRVSTWGLCGVLVAAVIVQLLPIIGKSTAPDISHEFWLYEPDDSPGTLVATSNIDESDPHIRAWCYAMGRESRGRPFEIGAAFFVYRGVYIKISNFAVSESESKIDVEDEHYMLAATAARQWIDDHPRFKRYRSPMYGVNPASFGSSSIDWMGIFMSVVILSTGAVCIVRWTRSMWYEHTNARRYRRLRAGACPECDYNLGGEYQRPCPECGSNVGEPTKPA